MPLNQISFDFENAITTATQPKPIAAAPLVLDATTVIDISEIQEKRTTKATKQKSNKKTTRGRVSLKEGALGIDLIEVPEDDVLFQKMYYPIGTVADMFKVNQSLIRFWANEFDVLKPKKNGKGDRLFRPEDVKNLKLIYHLLRERKYTVEGAKDFLKNNRRADEKFAMIESLKKIRGFLLELKANL
jgi:DNA-binding transcriptional MerR regulator